MFSSIGWTEMLVIAVIAIIFVGPKDLPSMLRQFGRFSRKVRSVAGDFQKQVDDALRESELDSVRDSINEVRSLDPRKALKDQLNPLKDDPKAEPDPNAHPTATDVPTPATDAPLVFDEDAAPPAPEPVKVDVEAALARQAKLDAEAGQAAVETTAAKSPVKKASSKKPAAKKPAARKSVVKKPATKADA